MNESPPKVSVIHSFPVWLPQTQTWMYYQVQYLPDDIEAHIVCEKTENLDQFRLANIHALHDVSWIRKKWDRALRKYQFRRYLGFLVSCAKKQQADIIHSHFGNIGWANMGAVKRTDAKHIVTFYGRDVNHLPLKEPVWKNRYQDLFAHVDRVLCEGSHMAHCVIGLGCPGEKVMVHHLGVRVDQIRFQPRVKKTEEPLRVLIAASFHEKKGIPFALEALGKFQTQVPLEITIIGDASNQTESSIEKNKIIATIRKKGLQDKVRMLGFQPHEILIDEAYKHHVFLSPSITAADGDTEGGAPVSIIEMVATGMPVISTEHCDIPEVIQSGITGLLAKERDVDGLVRHLEWLIKHPELWPPMLEAGRCRIEAEYDARTQGERLGLIYKEHLDYTS